MILFPRRRHDLYALNDSEMRPEIWTKLPNIPTASAAKDIEALSLHAVWHWMLVLTQTIQFELHPSLSEKNPQSFCDCLSSATYW